LKARIIGRGYKVKRADLDEFIKRLWKKKRSQRAQRAQM
jgi:hypothetical protein